jgi:hypothetical protein
LDRLLDVCFRCFCVVLSKELEDFFVEVVFPPVLPLLEELEHDAAGKSFLFTLKEPEKETLSHRLCHVCEDFN